MQVLAASDAAHRLFARGDGFQVRDGALVSSGVAVIGDLRAAMRNRERSLVVACGARGEPVLALFEPLPSLEGHLSIVTLLRPGALPATVFEPLAQFYGLSRAQARVTWGVITGRTVEQIGRRLNVKEDTVRSHLKSVFEKTGAHSQSGLVAAFLRCFCS